MKKKTNRQSKRMTNKQFVSARRFHRHHYISVRKQRHRQIQICGFFFIVFVALFIFWLRQAQKQPLFYCRFRIRGFYYNFV